MSDAVVFLLPLFLIMDDNHSDFYNNKTGFFDQSFDQVVSCVFSTGHNYVLLASLLLSSFEACGQKAVKGLKTGIIKCI